MSASELMTNPSQTALEPKGEKTLTHARGISPKKTGRWGGVLKFGQDAEKNYDREAQLG